MISPLERAVHLAVRVHTGQMDEDGMPHIIHCFEVLHRVQEMLSGYQFDKPALTQYTQEEIEISAILHDTVEDSFENPTALERVDLQRVESLFGKNVRDIVDSVTRRKYLDGVLNYEIKADAPGVIKEFYRDFIYRAKAHEGGRLLKIADLYHNYGRSDKIKKANWRNKLQFKYSTALAVLNDSSEPTWEQASMSVIHEGPHARYFVGDPNGKKIEVTHEEFMELTKKDGHG